MTAAYILLGLAGVAATGAALLFLAMVRVSAVREDAFYEANGGRE